MAEPLGEGPITEWIRDLKAGDAGAAQRLWERYYDRLVHFAADKLKRTRSSGGISDEEDAALSAFKSFCIGASLGRYPQINDRQELWSLLLTITARKVVSHVRYETRDKRGGGDVVRQSELEGACESPTAFWQTAGRDPSPVFAMMVAEVYEKLLACLHEKTLRTVAIMKMEGYTNDEIARSVGVVRRTVIRKLDVIRQNWMDLGYS
jgi:DNA-directed RNA polymerase specialized sigma24 family protein